MIQKLFRPLSISLIFVPALLFAQSKLIIHQIDVSNFPTLRAYVSVLDSTGESVKGLDYSHFSVKDDSIPVGRVECTSVFSNREWVTIVLSIDKSGSMKGEALENAQKGAALFLDKVGLQDRIALSVFDNDVHWKTGFTKDKAILAAEIEKLKPFRNTALYDALIQGVSKLEQEESPRKALVILTDGKDTESRADLSDCLARLDEVQIPVYMIGLGDDVNKDVLQKVAETSKGSAFFTTQAVELQKIYADIASLLENQYILTFDFSGDRDIATHTLAVSVSTGTESLSDKIFYSPLVFERGDRKNERQDFPDWQKLRFPVGAGFILGLLLFWGMSHILFKGSRIGKGLIFVFVISGALLTALIVAIVSVLI